jgi:soluble lytic murein transglycosylase-like protein
MIVVAIVVVAVAVPAAGNIGGALPATLRSGQYVRWMPSEIDALMRALRTEGSGRADAAELAQIVHSESSALHVDPLYALALMKVESNFRADAVSPRGAVGLLQIRPDTARSVARIRPQTSIAGRPLRITRLRDPRTNVAAGLRYLRRLEKQFQDPATALAAYNLGPTRVRRDLKAGKPPPRAYADRVLTAYRALNEHRAARRVDPDGG